MHLRLYLQIILQPDLLNCAAKHFKPLHEIVETSEMVDFLQINSREIASKLVPGPVAIVRNEDDFDLTPSIQHLEKLGFENIFILGSERSQKLPQSHFIEVSHELETHQILNHLMDMLEGRWVYHGFNSEYLFFPFCEARQILDVLQFVEEERRSSVFCTTVDLYPSQIDRDTIAFDHDDAYFDSSGYYSRDRYDGPNPLERQIDIFGGLKWRYSEHVKWERQRIDRMGLFQARKGLRMDEAGLFSDPEMNTISCPWHNNLTCAIASFRVAKSLLNNPGSTFEIESFMWPRSKRFEWSAGQLMDSGLMEPGQWF